MHKRINVHMLDHRVFYVIEGKVMDKNSWAVALDELLHVGGAKFDSNALAQARREIRGSDDSDATCQLLNQFLLGINETGRDAWEKSGKF